MNDLFQDKSSFNLEIKRIHNNCNANEIYVYNASDYKEILN